MKKSHELDLVYGTRDVYGKEYVTKVEEALDRGKKWFCYLGPSGSFKSTLIHETVEYLTQNRIPLRRIRLLKLDPYYQLFLKRNVGPGKKYRKEEEIDYYGAAEINNLFVGRLRTEIEVKTILGLPREGMGIIEGALTKEPDKDKGPFNAMLEMLVEELGEEAEYFIHPVRKESVDISVDFRLIMASIMTGVIDVPDLGFKSYARERLKVDVGKEYTDSAADGREIKRALSVSGGVHVVQSLVKGTYRATVGKVRQEPEEMAEIARGFAGLPELEVKIPYYQEGETVITFGNVLAALVLRMRKNGIPGGPLLVPVVRDRPVYLPLQRKLMEEKEDYLKIEKKLRRIGITDL